MVDGTQQATKVPIKPKLIPCEDGIPLSFGRDTTNVVLSAFDGAADDDDGNDDDEDVGMFVGIGMVGRAILRTCFNTLPTMAFRIAPPQKPTISASRR